MELFLTGGTGYLGRALADRLLVSGHRLRLLYRTGERLPAPRPGLLPVKGDLARTGELRDAIAGVDAICHTAAITDPWVSRTDTLRAVNVNAVRSLIDLAGELGVRRVIVTSCFLALGPDRGRPVTEESSTERTRFMNVIERAAYLGDTVAREAQARGAPVTILYPTQIIGPGALTSGNRLGRLIAALIHDRLPLPLGSPDATGNWIHVRDVVTAHEAALDRDDAGERFILAGENATRRHFLECLAELGVPLPRWSLSRPVSRWVARGLELQSRVLGGTPAVSRRDLDVWERSWSADGGKAVRVLGVRPMPLRAALESTVAWVRASPGIAARAAWRTRHRNP